VNNAQFIKTETADLQEILGSLLEDWVDIAADKGVILQKGTIDPVIFSQTNYSLCQMMIQNGLSNAVKYVQGGGEILLSGKMYADCYEIVIENDGEGIDEKLLAQVKNGLVFLKDVTKEKSGFGLQIMFKIAIFLGVGLEIISENRKTRVLFKFPIENQAQ
jgi:signal transduction histidine kinase